MQILKEIKSTGQLDRIGSMNDTIREIKFWPGKNYEDYLRLKKRVEERMALMSVVGTELQDITPEFQKMVEENPLLPKQAQKMLDQSQIIFIVFARPKIYSSYGIIYWTYSVNPTHALNEANRIPMYIIVYNGVAILQVLSFA